MKLVSIDGIIDDKDLAFIAFSQGGNEGDRVFCDT
jgi:hypothetical protein